MFWVGVGSDSPSALEEYHKSGRRQPDMALSHAKFNPDDQQNADRKILFLMWDLIRDTSRRIKGTIFLRLQEKEKDTFEVGYLMATIQDKYRKMVELYNNSWTYRRQLLMMDALLMSSEIQTFYFELQHLINMMHEVERKYASGRSFYSKVPNSWTKATTKVKAYKDKREEEKEQVQAFVDYIKEVQKKQRQEEKRTKRALIKRLTTNVAAKQPLLYVSKIQNEYDLMWNYRFGTTPRHLQPRPFAKWRPYHYGWEVNYDWRFYDNRFHSPRKLYSGPSKRMADVWPNIINSVIDTVINIIG